MPQFVIAEYIVLTRVDMYYGGLNQGLSSSRFVHSIHMVVALIHYISIQSKDIGAYIARKIHLFTPIYTVAQL